MTTSRIRALSLVALVTAVVLGTVYLLGRTVADSVRDDSGRGTAAPRHVAGTGPTRSGDQIGSSADAGRPAEGSGRPVGPSASATGPSGTNAAGAATGPGPVAGAPGRNAQHAAAERPRLSLQLNGGPYGSRSTTGSREVALTFDDGPDPSYTPQTLALLRQYQVRATFCLVGTNVEQYPDLVRAIAADGHTLCNHSWSHDLSLGRRSRARIQADLVRTNEALRAAVPGARIGYFRQPGGNWTPNVVAVAHALGMTPLHWTVDPQDWRRPGAGSISATVTGGTFSGAIVLLHDAGGDRRQTVSALRSILPNLSQRFALTALPYGDQPDPPVFAPGSRPG